MRIFASLAITLFAVPALAGGSEWVEGVPYRTDFKAAIKEARSTGKILLIYNGWQREKV